MKINKHIKLFFLGFLGFVVLCFVIYFSQQKKYESLIKEGKYTIGVGEKIKKNRTGWTFIYTYKVNNEIYEGRNSATGIREEFAVGGIYFVVFDPNKPKKNFLIKYPTVPAEINLDSIPVEGWSELPVPVPKDSIRNFLD
ncbi:hypothetical protein [Moheibacter lacus]|uniref:DUF3592 domain-containing protein n=1 Tax=Moheibacter lacus TaxID=2745851 RepID=A0A838ZS40_9FLAO|nr:hypothetical protein [Moheibacter lacus]MBA5629643.1 hypothetical protein [Moheibacter lacus]